MKKRKKLTRPSTLVTFRPPVTNSTAGALDLSKEQEPGTTPPGALPRPAVPRHICTDVTLNLVGIGMFPACPAHGQA